MQAGRQSWQAMVVKPIHDKPSEIVIMKRRLVVADFVAENISLLTIAK
jgi:hypothetical protein